MSKVTSTESRTKRRTQISLRSVLRSAVMWDPLVLGWTRRMYVGAGLGEKNETDYLFDLVQNQKDIFVLQIGANDGKRHDPLSIFIHKYHWQGLLLEPLPDIFASLRLNYANDKHVTLLNAAMADRDGDMTFYRVEPGPGIPDNCNELGSFYRDVIKKHSFIFPEIEKHIVEETIAVVSFPTLVRQQHIKKIDVIFIDTEGYDFEILKLIDFHQFRPKLVVYEHMHLSQQDQNSASQLLAGFGYKIHPLTKSGDANTAAIYGGH
jgi:FkbM family methyltransferase